MRASAGLAIRMPTHLLVAIDRAPTRACLLRPITDGAGLRRRQQTASHPLHRRRHVNAQHPATTTPQEQAQAR